MKTLEVLLEEAKTRTMSDEERSAQRKSFAFGNAKISNDRVTREMVESEAKKVNRKITRE